MTELPEPETNADAEHPAEAAPNGASNYNRYREIPIWLAGIWLVTTIFVGFSVASTGDEAVADISLFVTTQERQTAALFDAFGFLIATLGVFNFLVVLQRTIDGWQSKV